MNKTIGTVRVISESLPEGLYGMIYLEEGQYTFLLSNTLRNPRRALKRMIQYYRLDKTPLHIFKKPI